jgi:hypothetical protein
VVESDCDSDSWWFCPIRMILLVLHLALHLVLRLALLLVLMLTLLLTAPYSDADSDPDPDCTVRQRPIKFFFSFSFYHCDPDSHRHSFCHSTRLFPSSPPWHVEVILGPSIHPQAHARSRPTGSTRTLRHPTLPPGPPARQNGCQPPRMQCANEPEKTTTENRSEHT